MNKTRVTLLFVLMAIAVGGIMLIQVFWVQNALRMQNEQFSRQVQMGLKKVVTQLTDPMIDTTNNYMRYCNRLNNYEWINVNDLIQSNHLQRLLAEEMAAIGKELRYEYGVYKSGNDTLLKVSNKDFAAQIKHSPHTTSLVCLQRSDGYMLAVFFPDQKSFVSNQVMLWVVLLWALILLMIGASYAIIASFRKEKDLSRMKSDFVNNMTHELKTPLASISLAADMLIKPEVSKESCQVQRYAKIISDENSRLKNRVEQVLHITLVERGEFKLQKRLVDVNKIMEESIKPFRLLVRHQKGKFITKFANEKLMINADPEHLENIISNLIDNAIKYSIGAPEVTLETKSNGSGVVIAVEDKGIGISSEHQKNVFKRFYRVPTGDKHDTKGFGLGLFYVKSIAEAHQGQVHLKSQPGIGSRFEILLPFGNDKKT